MNELINHDTDNLSKHISIVLSDQKKLYIKKYYY